MHKVRKLFNDNNVPWQAAELGKMDKGGGGTIAQFVANLGSEVIDCGIPVIGMHSTLEVASKADLYSAYLGYKAFMKNGLINHINALWKRRFESSVYAGFLY